MKYAELPDGTQLEFPDETRQDVMDAAVRRHMSSAGDNTTRDDVLKTLPYILPKAATGLAGLPGTINELAKAGGEKLSQYLPDEPGWLRSANSAMRGASLTNIIGSRMPSSGDLRKGLEKYTGAWHDPETRTGKVVDTAGQTAATLGSGLLTAPLRSAALTGGITAGTEGVGALTNDNPVARLLGGLLGGGGVAGVNAYKNAPQAIVSKAVGDINPAEILKAIERQELARKQGVPLMGPESLPESGIQQLASDVMASREGAARMRPALAQRPDQIRAGVQRNVLDPIGNSGTPAENAARAQQAATDVIAAAEGRRSAAVAPFYKAAENESIPAQSMRPVSDAIQGLIYKNPIGASADKALGNWYNQAFPHTVESVAAPAGPKQAPKRGAPFVNPEQDDVITAIRKLGGISAADEAVGSLAKANPFPPSFDGAVWRNRTGGSLSKTGHSLDTMAQHLEQRGYPVSSPDDVMEAIANAGLGKPTYATAYQFGRGDPMVELTDTLRDLTSQFRAKNNPSTKAPDLGVGAALPETNVGRLTSLYKNLGMERDAPAIGATAEQKMSAYPAGKVQDALGDVLKQNNPNVAKGMQRYADITRDVIEPLQAGPVGRLATRQGFEAGDQASVAKVTGAIGDVHSVRPADIKTLYTHLNAQDKQAFPGMARSYLENAFNDATKRVQSGDNRMMGANFAKDVAGTDQQRANLTETLRGVAHANGVNAEQYVAGVDRFMQTLQATGKIPGIGSPTGGRTNLHAELGKSATADIASAFSTKPFGWLTDRIRSAALSGREGQLAEIFTAPDSVQQIVKFAKLKPNGLTAQYYLASMLGLDRAAN